MCRLLGFVATAPTTPRALLGEGDLEAFTRLAVKHGDGWGFAVPVTDPGPARPAVSVVKAPDSARRSPHFVELAGGLSAELCMVHLRWATLHLATREANTHPFTDGHVAFCHNGSISPPAALDALIAPDLLAQRRRDTDSERYFLALLTRLRRVRDPVQALAATVADVARVQHTSLNAMLLTPDALYAVCSYDQASEQDESEPDYYRLHHTVRDGAVLVASSGWGSGWQALGNDEVLVVRRTGETSVHRLRDVRARARHAG